jgi:tetratricopeptide (TPR) repeat protein
MSTLTFSKLKIPAAHLNGESSLPSIADMKNVQQTTKTILDEDDELFIGYGFLDSPFPYRLQDMYHRKLTMEEIDCAILENEYLKAVFVPSLGGRLWSLFDKKEGRELTFSNAVFRPGNLAFRNAWFSGGVEWNCGVVGHSPFTCSQLFTAKLTAEDGTPVLRMYEFERIRRATYQMDFFLPKESKVLLCRMRIVNPNTETVPMYWWSNIAVPELKDGRVVMSTNETFTNRGGLISKTTVPVSDSIDITYPTNNPHAVDFFWKLKAETRKYVCQLNKEGYGLIQTSTNRLKGRKLFVWGQGPGGERWQEFLSNDIVKGRYAEIQAGLAHTQYECLPMPPKTAWEWMEAYGAMHADGNKVHGDWDAAKAEVEKRLTEMLDAEKLEKLLVDTRKSIAMKPAEEIIFHGSGWGALENLRRREKGEMPISEHLDFGAVGQEQEQWVSLLKNGYFQNVSPHDIPISWMYQTEWTEMLEGAVKGTDEYNWYTWLHLGVIYFVQRKIQEAKKALDQSMKLKPSCWALYGLSNVARVEEEIDKAAMLAMRAAHMKPEDASLAKEAMKMMLYSGMYTKVINLAEKLPDYINSIGRIKLYKAFAYLHIGELEQAEMLLYEGGGIVVPDIREGENSVTDLWFQIEEKKAAKEGRSFDYDEIEPPANLDFRMNAIKRKQN